MISSHGDEILTVKSDPMRTSVTAINARPHDIPFNVSPRLATCFVATKKSSSPFFPSFSTSTTSTPPEKSWPCGRCQSPSVNFMLDSRDESYDCGVDGMSKRVDAKRRKRMSEGLRTGFWNAAHLLVQRSDKYTLVVGPGVVTDPSRHGTGDDLISRQNVAYRISMNQGQRRCIKTHRGLSDRPTFLPFFPRSFPRSCSGASASPE
jgi:hypothetical protein